MAANELSATEIAARLNTEVQRYVLDGYRVVSVTPPTAYLVKPKEFNVLLAGLGFLFCFVGLGVYILYYVAQRDTTVVLTVDAWGVVHTESTATGAGALPTVRMRSAQPQSGPQLSLSGLLICPACGHENPTTARNCSRCRAALWRPGP